MLRSPLLFTVGPMLSLAYLLTGGSAAAAQTNQGYAPSATVTVQTPQYAPPPTYQQSYAPPPTGGYVQAQGGYGYQQPQASYASPRYGSGMEVARPGWSVGALLGFGFNTVYGFGLGVRGGYTLPQKVYIGGEFGYYFGGSALGVSFATYNIGPEVGYDIALAGAPVLIRPYVGLGYQGVTVGEAPFCGNACPSNSVGGFTIWGGAIGTYSFTRNWSAGVDLRLMLPTFGDAGTESDVALTLAATGVYKF